MEGQPPRHLNDETAMIPAVPSAPKHSAEDPDRRGTPYLDSTPRVTRAEARAEYARRLAEGKRYGKAPWWKRWMGIA